MSLVEGARAALALLQRQRAQDQNALVLLVGQPLPADLPPGLPLDGAGPAGRAAGRAAVGAAGAPPRRAPGRAPAAGRQRQHRRGARGLLPAHHADRQRRRWPATTWAGCSSNRAWQFAPRITLPIFDAGANQANLELSQANRDIAVAQYERSIQMAFREVADALAGRATLGEQLRAQQAQAQAEADALATWPTCASATASSSYLDVLDAQRALFQTQQATIVVQAAQQQNLVTLYKVLGGGWKDAAN